MNAGEVDLLVASTALKALLAPAYRSTDFEGAWTERGAGLTGQSTAIGWRSRTRCRFRGGIATRPRSGRSTTLARRSGMLLRGTAAVLRLL